MNDDIKPMIIEEPEQPKDKDDEASVIDLRSPYSFVFDWYSGPVLQGNTEYGISVFIKKTNWNMKPVGSIRIKTEYYPVTEELASKIESHVRDNFEELTKLALRWNNSRTLEGSVDTMLIKCDAVTIQLGLKTVPSDRESFVAAFENDIERFVRESKNAD